MKNTDKKSIAAMVGATMVGALVAPIAGAESNPFALNELSSGYTHVAEMVPYQPKAGEQQDTSKQDSSKPQEAKCGQGKCGGEMMKNPQMKCGAGMAGMQQSAPAQPEKAMEGKCAGMKMDGGAAMPK